MKFEPNIENVMPPDIAASVEANGVAKVSKDSATVFALAVTAGVFIGLAFAFYATVLTGAGTAPWGLVRLVGGLVFSMGLGLIIVCGGELFTSTVLTSLACASGHVSGVRMLRHWTLVYGGNLLGALLLASVMLASRSYGLAEGAWGVTVLKIAQHKLHHGFGEAVALGVLCNLLVCLAVWMTYSARSVGEKTLVLMLPVAMFVSSGFEHVVANMFIVPLGIAIHATAEPAFWTAAGVPVQQFNDLTLANFVVNNMLPVTIGNIIGGLAVGMTYWYLYRRTRSMRSFTAATTGQPLSRSH